MDMAATSISNNNQENMLAELRQIIYKGDTEAVLPFLQQYQQGNMTVLKEAFKQAKRYWENSKDYPNNLEINPEHNYSEEYYRRPYNKNRTITIVLLGFALLNLSDVNTTWFYIYYYLSEIIKDEKLFSILKEIKPIWLTEYLKIQVRDKDMTHRTYQELQILEQHQLIEFDPELFALSIVSLTHEQGQTSYEIFTQYTTDEIIYQRDIPTLFDYETRLFEEWYGTWQDKKVFWHEVFIQLIQEQKLDRLVCIQKILEVQTKDWYSHTKAFFKKMMAVIEPTSTELLQLQDSIFLLLHSEYSATVNYAIETIQPLLNHADFNFTEYLTWLEAVMPRADVKSGIKMILQQMLIALKHYPEQQENILNLVADTFLQSDFDLQERAAKILVKNLKFEHYLVIDKIRMYQDNMIGGITVLLKSYLNDENVKESKVQSQQEYVYTIPQPHYLKPENKIQLPQTWQELLFFMGETIQSDNPLNFDIFMSAWLILKPQFPKNYQKQLKPIIKQMEKWTSSYYKGFFNDFFVKIYHEPHKEPNNYGYKLPYYIKFLRNYSVILETFAQFSYEEVALPLLSLPTHAPSYIDPKILVQRLLEYQQNNIEFNLVDLAMALCRTPRENIEPALVLLEKINNNKLRQLLCFHFGKIAVQPDFAIDSDFKEISLTGKMDWCGLWDTAIQTHDLEIKNNILPYRLTPSHKMNFNKEKNSYEYLDVSQDVAFDVPLFKQEALTYIYPCLCFSSQAGHNNLGVDFVFYRHFSPLNQIQTDLYFAVDGCYHAEKLHDDISNLLLRYTGEDYILNPYSLFILATHSFNKVREIRFAVSETLIHCLNQNKVDLVVLAKHYAILIYANYAPFSRLSDCLTAIKGSSAVNDRALIQLLSLIFNTENKPENFPTQFKKLFELYYELICQYQVKLEKAIQPALQLWQEQFPSLKSIIQKILKEVA